MNDFHRALTYVNRIVYQPNHFTIQEIHEERYNPEYSAGIFLLNTTSIRFRVAKITPTKIGQFVAIREKDEHHHNRPFSYDSSPDLLVINTFSENQFGQFVFPKEILAARNILKTEKTNGKMAFRVYPSWDTPTSKQAIATQKWQLPYFMDLGDTLAVPSQKILELYG
ncbi:mep operon protein MepB [Sporosarcina sp. BI001-red]|uniref:MepB family protein n=1 Tax=Sporosarcina sp. BI001-red TaxID=2282866 RepID=UPI000E2770C2|nr:MepB family protein [Sporosarcina sp. BI001-red]REB05159.1 mep operon protein MepB [Sporosarcina sp. BI001-red]